MDPIIKLSDNAADRIKEIMSSAEKDALGVRVSVKSKSTCPNTDVFSVSCLVQGDANKPPKK